MVHNIEDYPILCANAVSVFGRPANSDFFVKSKFGNQKSKTESELNSEIRFNRIRI